MPLEEVPLLMQAEVTSLCMQVKKRSAAILKHYPRSACSPEVRAAAEAAEVGRQDRRHQSPRFISRFMIQLPRRGVANQLLRGSRYSLSGSFPGAVLSSIRGIAIISGMKERASLLPCL